MLSWVSHTFSIAAGLILIPIIKPENVDKKMCYFYPANLIIFRLD